MGRLLGVSVVAAILAVAAFASAPPVGQLPKGPVTFVQLAVGKTYTVKLPQPKVAGRVWRIARPFDGKVVRETREAETKQQVLVSFRTVGKGTTSVIFAMTLGERSHAYAAHTYRFVIGR